MDWRKAKKIVKCLSTVIVFFYIYSQLLAASKLVPYDQDEIHTFYETESFTVLKKHDFYSSYWKSFSNFDHPPLSRYIYGYYLTLLNGDYSIRRNNLIKKYGEWVYGQFDSQSNFEISQFPQYINQMRHISILLSWLTIILVCILMYKLTNIFFSLGAAILMVHNTLFISTMIKALPDASFIFFSTLSIMTFVFFLQRKTLRFLFLSGVCGGLSFASKLIGIINFIAIPAYLLIDIQIARKKMGEQIYKLLLVVLVGFNVWLVINPTLYSNPVKNTQKYFSIRRDILVSQILDPSNSHVVLDSFKDRVHALWKFFIYSDEIINGNLTQFPIVNLFSFLVGCFFMIKNSFLKQGNLQRFIIIYTMTIFSYIFPFLQLSWPRYYLPFLIPYIILCTYGIYCLLYALHLNMFAIFYYKK